MRKHKLVGRFGPMDRTPVRATGDEVLTQIDLVASQRRLGYGLGQAIEDLVSMGVYPTELGLDIAILAALVHAADTRIERATESQDSWTRQLHL
jgi:hypothetical protein